jgi:hypothetical protein
MFNWLKTAASKVFATIVATFVGVVCLIPLSVKIFGIASAGFLISLGVFAVGYYYVVRRILFTREKPPALPAPSEPQALNPPLKPLAITPPKAALGSKEGQKDALPAPLPGYPPPWSPKDRSPSGRDLGAPALREAEVSVNEPDRPTLEFYDGSSVKTAPEYIKLFTDYMNANSDTFRGKILIILNYCKKYIKKKEFLTKTLLAGLSTTELTYIKFSGILTTIDNSICKTLNDILFRLHAFDEEEYEQILKTHPKNTSTYIERKNIFSEYTNYINSSIDFIDRLLLKIDKLQLETTKVKSLDYNSIEKLNSVQEIDELIEKMKLYKL